MLQLRISHRRFERYEQRIARRVGGCDAGAVGQAGCRGRTRNDANMAGNFRLLLQQEGVGDAVDARHMRS
jgi:hypothetical protein